jgi:hypothetical protein
MSKYVAKSERFTLSLHKFAIAFSMILNPSIHTTDTERNITWKYWESLYKKYGVYRYSGNIEITTCTTATVTTTSNDFSKAAK